MHTIASQRVERGKGLIEQQQLGFAHQRTGQRGALRLSTGQGERPGVEPMAKADFLQRGLRPVADGIAFQAQRDILPDRFPRQQSGILEHDGAAVGHLHILRAGIVQPGEGAQQGGLARSRPAQQGDELARRDFQVQPVDDAVGAKAAGEVLQANDRFGMRLVRRAVDGGKAEARVHDQFSTMLGRQTRARASRDRTSQSAPRPRMA